jgi:hypothetical protein
MPVTAEFNALPAVARRLQGAMLLFAIGMLGTATDAKPVLAQVDRYELIRRGGVSDGLLECLAGEILCKVNAQGQPIPGTCVDCGSTKPNCPASSITFFYPPLSARTCDAFGGGARACNVRIGGILVEGTCSTVDEEESPEDGRTAPCSPVICAPLWAMTGTCGQVGAVCTLLIEGSAQQGICTAADSGATYCRIS